MKTEENMETVNSRLRACILGFLITLREKTDKKEIDWYAKKDNQYEVSLVKDAGHALLRFVPHQIPSGHLHNFVCSFAGGGFFDNYDYIADDEVEKNIASLAHAITQHIEDRRKREMSSSEKKLVDKLEKMLGWDD